MKKLWLLAFRAVKREWRAGELVILALAIMVAVTSTSTINLFADRLSRTMILQGADFLAADMAVSSHNQIPDQWAEYAQLIDLKYANIAQFSSVVIFGDEMLLSGIKAVSTGYPLRGQLKTSPGLDADAEVMNSIPENQEAWVDRRVLARLGVKLGDTIEVGELPVKITRIITSEPDHKGNFSSLMPRVMINHDALAATKIIQPGSHVHYLKLFAGNEANVRQLKQTLDKQLRPGDRILDVFENRPELSKAVTRAQQYLGLASVVVVVIAGVAIAMAARRYSERHFDTTAILRCFGLKHRQVLILYAIQLGIIGLCASTIGVMLGWIGQEGLLYLLRDLLPTRVAEPGIIFALSGILMGLVILAGFALPPILRQREVPALRVLRRDLEPLPASGWLVYGLALAVVVGLVWPHVQDGRMLLITIGIGLLVMAVFSGLILALLSGLRKIVPGIAMPWRIGVRSIAQQWRVSLAQILAFTLTLTAMLILAQVRGDLLNNWQQQLPENAPNYFAMNVFTDEWQAFDAYLRDNNVESKGIYPIVRGRVIKVNGKELRGQVKPGSKAERWLDRDFNMTSSAKLPEDNTLIAGSWWQSDSSHAVSIEQKLAEDLGVSMGDTITYAIGATQLEARVISLRQVEWDTMNPNFFMIFAPHDLDEYSTTYLTSFYLSAQQQPVLRGLLRAYPHVTLLEVDLILEQLRKIVKQVSLAVEYILYFALAAGLMVLFAAVFASMDERIYLGVILRSFGASRSMIRIAQLSEFFTLGFLSGLLAVILSEIINWNVYLWVFKLDYTPTPILWLIVPFASALLVTAAGMFSSRKVLRESPMQVLRKL
ncbi:MAG: FtsX-like permease family protein [Methylococcales bacterium]